MYGDDLFSEVDYFYFQLEYSLLIISVQWLISFPIVFDGLTVRCLIMESFLGIEWENYGSCAKALPESFVLGPFMQGLNDPVHHKNFG